MKDKKNYFACGLKKLEPTKEHYCKMSCPCVKEKRSFLYEGKRYHNYCSYCLKVYLRPMLGAICSNACNPTVKKHKEKNKRIDVVYKKKQHRIIYFMQKIEKRNYWVSTEELFDLLEIWECLPRTNRTYIDELVPKKQIEVAFKELKVYYETILKPKNKTS